MKPVTIIENLKLYLGKQIDSISRDTPIVHIMKPIIVRVINNNYNKVYNMVNLLADENGEIDIENIITEMIDNLVTSPSFIVHTNILGDLEIGNGLIKINIPFTEKKLVLNKGDVETFKDMLTNKE